MPIFAGRIDIRSLVFLFIACIASDEEHRLLSDLRVNYDPAERPVANGSEPVDVHLRILLQQLVDVDEKNQIVTLVLWMQFTWTDWKMVWSPEEYGHIQDVRFPFEALWKPDILLFNSADEKFDARFPVNFVVQHTGQILHAPPAIIKSSCDIDITWFPFDEQICFLKYGLWTYPGDEVELFIDDKGLEGGNKIDTSYYVPNGEWELVATPGRKIVSLFEGKSYVELYYYLHIRRKTVYYGMNWIIPSILFLLLNVLGFSMPSECGEKITLQTQNLLSVTLFLGMVADVTPPTSTSVPIIAAFFSVSMVVLGSSIILTLLIINVHFRSPRTHKMSPWVRTIFLEWLPWLLLMSRPGKQFKRPTCLRRSLRRSGDSSIHSSRHAASRAPSSFLCAQTGSTPANTPNIAATFEDSAVMKSLRATLLELSGHLRLRQQKMDEEEEEEEAKADWRFMGLALDRACLFLYSFLSALVAVWIFMSTPNPTSQHAAFADDNSSTIMA